jgi:hypothetical protein
VNRPRSFLTPAFRKLYSKLPEPIQRLADKKYQTFRKNPFHPSLAFQAKGKSVNGCHRALIPGDCAPVGDDLHCVGIAEILRNAIMTKCPRRASSRSIRWASSSVPIMRARVARLRRCAAAPGFSTEAVFIFHNMLRKLLKERHPIYIAAIFESAEPTHRRV